MSLLTGNKRSILQPLVLLNSPLNSHYHCLKASFTQFDIWNVRLQWETAINQDLQQLHCDTIQILLFSCKQIHIHFYNATVAKVNLLYHPFTTITCGLTQHKQPHSPGIPVTDSIGSVSTAPSAATTWLFVVQNQWRFFSFLWGRSPSPQHRQYVKGIKAFGVCSKQVATWMKVSRFLNDTTRA